MNVKTVKIKPCHPKHKIWYKRARYKVMKGGRCGTKSWGVGEAIIHFTNTCRVRVGCARQHKNKIDSSTRQVIVDTIERYGLSDNYDIQASVITNKFTGSTITFMGLDPKDKQSLKGLEGYNILWIDEAEGVTEDVMSVVTLSIRGNRAEIWLTYNPASPDSWVAQTFEERTPPPNSLIESINYLEVLHVIPSEMLEEAEHYKNTNYDLYCHVWLGEYKLAGDEALFDSIKLHEAYMREPVINLGANVVLGIDPAGNGGDDNVFIIRRGYEILFYHEIKRVSNEKRFSLVQQMIAKYQVNWVVVDCGGGFGDELMEKLEPRYGHMSKRFMSGYAPSEPQYYNTRVQNYCKLRDWVYEGGGFLNMEEAPRSRIFKELTGIKYEVNNSGKMVLESKKKMLKSPDAADALMVTFFNVPFMQEPEDEYDDDFEIMAG